MRNTSKGARIAIYIGLFLWMIINLFPVYWMFTFSLKNNAEIFGENVVGLPRNWLWSNYTSALNTGNMGRYFLNSAIVATATILITLVVALGLSLLARRFVVESYEIPTGSMLQTIQIGDRLCRIDLLASVKSSSRLCRGELHAVKFSHQVKSVIGFIYEC